ncbi:hypothetical protein IE53DRAFT_319707 [Violaceomyces palustris]|uniref:Uncharacterized protein n=1 Tax=Violaceomyces palustris TaxID=1673888 RepID=A0ACD0NR16_9BASI|nr:hypothetical protein IE53DRAFT_319707 [Violaceomyces palustris]
MFGSLPHHEKQAFFSLMDEYFASRPHLLPSGPKSQPQSSSAGALYEYGDGTDPDDLPVKEGERIILLERISDDWWRGKKVDGTREEPGIVPSSYVRQL